MNLTDYIVPIMIAVLVQFALKPAFKKAPKHVWRVVVLGLAIGSAVAIVLFGEFENIPLEILNKSIIHGGVATFVYATGKLALTNGWEVKREEQDDTTPNSG